MTTERLHALYAKAIERQVRRMMGPDNENEDLVQEVLVTVLRRLYTLRDPAALDAWVAQITANTVTSAIRRRRLRRHLSLEAVSEQDLPVVTSDVAARELAGRAARILQRMPERERALLVTYWFSPATADSIAEVLRCSSATLKRRLRRARRRFERLASDDPALARRLRKH